MWIPVNAKNLYLEKGYINWEAVLSLPYTFIVTVGGRGGGKTYGSLLWCLEHQIRLMYLRRTQKQLKMIMKPKYQPFKKINSDLAREIVPTSDGDDLGSFIDKQTGALIGYLAALSTIANIRGFDGSDIGMMILDEFIPESGERILFDMFEALMNAYETINRNREIDGYAAMRLLMLSNSNSIYGDIITKLKIGSMLYEMQLNGIELMADPDRSLLVFLPQAVEFKKQKAETALYKLTAGTEFADMALDNHFMIQDERMIKIRPIREYRPLAAINDVVIYRHKSRSEFYVTPERTGGVAEYGSSREERKRYIRDFPQIAFAEQKKKIYFKDLDSQARFYQIYN